MHTNEVKVSFKEYHYKLLRFPFTFKCESSMHDGLIENFHLTVKKEAIIFDHPSGINQGNTLLKESISFNEILNILSLIKLVEF